ncbi:hypothetical protein [Pseudoalteromonas rubra]|uniref:hypothetical protein n=1 Tax=Pseudoalteromonas rubra TaxID=43658 RepID=UPI002DBF5116|nr:hypothetical protein [Pseudoalteromonas rubra]MEC4091862.1 hypothetical protein [Pseudoalteromonas rubra]
MWGLFKLFGIGKQRYTQRREFNGRRQVFDSELNTWVYVCNLDMTRDEYGALPDAGSCTSDSSPAVEG